MLILDLRKKIIDLAYLGSAYCFSVQLVLPEGQPSI